MVLYSGYDLIGIDLIGQSDHNQSIIPSTDMIQPTLTLKMTTAQVVETSVTVNNNSPIQDYVHPDDQTQPFGIYYSTDLLVKTKQNLRKPISLL